MSTKSLLTVTAAFECATGLGLLASPTMAVGMLLGPRLESPVGLVVARVLGAAMLALGLACFSAARRGANSEGSALVPGLLFYNLAVPAILIPAALSAGLQGLGLWPATGAHLLLAVWCGLRWRRK